MIKIALCVVLRLVDLILNEKEKNQILKASLVVLN